MTLAERGVKFLYNIIIQYTETVSLYLMLKVYFANG